MAACESSYKCPQCGTRYASKFQMSRGLGGYYCSDCNCRIIGELYHQTSPNAANNIVSSQTMKPGTKGLAGGGIYFAQTPYETNHKAHQKGTILKAQVDLGQQKYIGPNGDKYMNGNKLNNQGYDSVRIGRPGGTEHVVYDSNKVKYVTKW